MVVAAETAAATFDVHAPSIVDCDRTRRNSADEVGSGGDHEGHNDRRPAAAASVSVHRDDIDHCRSTAVLPTRPQFTRVIDHFGRPLDDPTLELRDALNVVETNYTRFDTIRCDYFICARKLMNAILLYRVEQENTENNEERDTKNKIRPISAKHITDDIIIMTTKIVRNMITANPYCE